MKPKIQTRVVAAQSAALAAVVFSLDLLTPLGVAESVLYLAVALVSFRTRNRRLCVSVAAVCTALILLGFTFSPATGEYWTGAANRLFVLVVLWLLTAAQLRRLHLEETAWIRYNAIASALNAMAVANLDGRLSYVNDAFLRAWGYAAPAEVLDRPATEFWSAPEQAAEVMRALQLHGHWTGELVGRRKDGSLFPALVSAHLVTGLHGAPACMMASFMDVTGQRHAAELQRNAQAELERQVAERTANLTAANLRLEREMTERENAEAALRESEKRFRQLAENIKEVFYIRDIGQDRMLYVSPAYEEIWGRPLNAIYENPADFISLVHPDDRDSVVAAREAQFAGKPFNAEYRIVRDDGTTRWIRARSFPVQDQTGRVYRIAGIAEDVTERKRLEEERFTLAQQQRDTLVREVHHRIKNNLQGVVGLLRQHVAQFPQARRLLENAIAQVQSVAIVHGLHSKRPDRRIRLCDMTNAIARAMESLTRARIEPEVDVDVKVARPIEVVEEEAVPVALILNELMFNAVKHGRQDAAHPVRVWLRSDHGTACVCIRSTGAGLPAGFDFAAGTGLGTGLSLLKSLLPHQGARLSFESDTDTVTAKLVLAPPIIKFQDSETGG